MLHSDFFPTRQLSNSQCLLDTAAPRISPREARIAAANEKARRDRIARWREWGPKHYAELRRVLATLTPGGIRYRALEKVLDAVKREFMAEDSP